MNIQSMAKTNSEKQADYRARMRAHHRQFTLYLPDEIADRAITLAASYGLNMNDFITMAIRLIPDGQAKSKK